VFLGETLGSGNISQTPWVVKISFGKGSKSSLFGINCGLERLEKMDRN